MSQSPSQKTRLELFTVGHSNIPLLDFVALIGKQQIEVIADVRSNPYSKYATHFSGRFLKKTLPEHGIKYVYLGQELGGMPKEQEFYDAEGHADYARLAASQKFGEGMERLERGLSIYRVAVMCAEEDPSNCHRHLLIAKAASERGIAVKHIRKGGELQDHESLARASAPEDFARQLNLFERPEKIELRIDQPQDSNSPPFSFHRQRYLKCLRCQCRLEAGAPRSAVRTPCLKTAH